MKPVNIGGRWQFLPFDLPQGISGKWKVVHKFNPAFEPMTVVSMRNAIFMGMKPKRMKFDQPVVIHSLQEGGSLWMTTIPQEVEQTARQLRKAHGHVLVGGLGLGLAVGILMKNPKVKSITVVEKSADVIELVWSSIIESSKLKIPLTILHDDLFAVLKFSKKKYGFAFYDIWCSCSTSQSAHSEYVLPLRRLSIGIVPQKNIECWNEEEMLGQIRQGIESHWMQKESGWESLLTISDKKFIETASGAYHRKYRRDLVFFAYARKMSFTSSKDYRHAADLFMAALKDPQIYDREWKAWEPVAEKEAL